MTKALKTGLPAKRPELTLTPELRQRILDDLASGLSMQEMESQEGMPNRRTIYRWLGRDTDFAMAYLAAKSAGTLALLDEIHEIADDSSGDIQYVDTERGEQVVQNNVRVNRDKLRIDTRKWEMAKLAPRIFGERSIMHHVGETDDAAIKIDAQMSPKEAAEAYSNMIRGTK